MGSPPPARGALNMGIMLQVYEGITPACAGSTIVDHVIVGDD